MLTRSNIVEASVHLLLCAQHMGGFTRRVWFVRGNAFYDQAPLAVGFGLRKYQSSVPMLVHSYLDSLFLAASLSNESTGLGELKEDEEGYIFTVTDEGKAHAECLERQGYRL